MCKKEQGDYRSRRYGRNQEVETLGERDCSEILRMEEEKTSLPDQARMADCSPKGLSETCMQDLSATDFSPERYMIDSLRWPALLQYKYLNRHWSVIYLGGGCSCTTPALTGQFDHLSSEDPPGF